MKQGLSQQTASYHTEWAYVKGLGFTLTFLALGSTLANFTIGLRLGEQLFSQGVWAARGTACLFVLLLYFCIDWVLKIILTDLSRAGQEGITTQDIYGNDVVVTTTNHDFLWRIAYIILGITTTISLTSNFMVADQLSGESPYSQYQQQLLASLTLTETVNHQAIETLAANSKDSTVTLKRERLMRVAINSAKSESWKNDYLAAADNMDAWFWTCQRCPDGYKAYRNRILAAMQEADALERQAQETAMTMATTIAQTVEGAADTTMLSKLEAVSHLLAEDQQSKEWFINVILLAMTLAGAVMSIVLTKLLKKHRQANGQLVHHNPARLLMKIAGVFTHHGAEILPVKAKEQEQQDMSLAHLAVETEREIASETPKRICQLEGCEADLDALGLRADALYCCKEHRYRGNAAKRKKKQENIFCSRTKHRLESEVG